MNPKNPFYVLGVTPDATPGEVEREGRKVLALLEVGSEKAKKYQCPLGEFERDATLVRECTAALRDPKQRARSAVLFRLFEVSDEVATSMKGHGPADQPDSPLPDAFLIGGFKGF